jgi:hypothetical protein
LWYKREVVRAYQSAVLVLAMFVAFIEAPFLHTHQHESTQHHSGPVFHLHLRSIQHSGNGPEFRGLNPDDDAQFQSWLSLTPTHLTPVAPAVPAQFFTVPALEASRSTVDAPQQRGHDPPPLTTQNPRAPPA